jgi:hypothetical protein
LFANSKHWAAIGHLFQASQRSLALFLSIMPLSGVFSWHCAAAGHASIIVVHLHNLTPRFISYRRISCARQMLATAFGDLFVSHAFIVGLPCGNFIKSSPTFIEHQS